MKIKKVRSNSTCISYPVFGLDAEYSIIKNVSYIQQVVKILEKETKPICFLSRGSSMNILSGAVAYSLQSKGKACKIVIIDKPGTRSHRCVYNDKNPYSFEKGYTYVIVDDLINTGNTIIETINCLRPNKFKKNIDYVFVSDLSEYGKMNLSQNNNCCKILYEL